MPRVSALALTVVLGLVAGALAPTARAADPSGAVIGDADEGLQVIVGPGGTSFESLAVPDARCVGGADAAACQELISVIRRDMTISFFFTVLPTRSYLVAAAEEPLASPSFADWNNIGAVYLIKGEVSGAGPYKVELRLYDVASRSNVPVDEQSFSDVARGGLRAVAHRFSNAVLKARTGKAGVFDTRIAYDRKLSLGVKGIGVVDMDGQNRSILISNGSINMLPAWGFGGLMYTSFAGGFPELYFGKRKLSRDTGHYRKVAVSPDGSRLVASISYGGQSDIYLLSKDGQVVKNLTNTEADEVSPTFSPDGGRVAYVSSAAGSPQIYVMGVDGGGGSRLTHAGSYNYAPDWGSNGLIAFATMTDGQSDIFTVTEGGDINRITQNQGSNKDPSWSRDGRYIAFVSARPEGSGIYIASADGRYQILVSKGGGYGGLAWER